MRRQTNCMIVAACEYEWWHRDVLTGDSDHPRTRCLYKSGVCGNISLGVVKNQNGYLLVSGTIQLFQERQCCSRFAGAIPAHYCDMWSRSGSVE